MAAYCPWQSRCARLNVRAYRMGDCNLVLEPGDQGDKVASGRQASHPDHICRSIEGLEIEDLEFKDLEIEDLEVTIWKVTIWKVAI